VTDEEWYSRAQALSADSMLNLTFPVCDPTTLSVCVFLGSPQKAFFENDAKEK
jgi:hypothetical protein